MSSTGTTVPSSSRWKSSVAGDGPAGAVHRADGDVGDVEGVGHGLGGAGVPVEHQHGPGRPEGALGDHEVTLGVHGQALRRRETFEEDLRGLAAVVSAPFGCPSAAAGAATAATNSAEQASAATNMRRNRVTVVLQGVGSAARVCPSPAAYPGSPRAQTGASGDHPRGVAAWSRPRVPTGADVRVVPVRSPACDSGSMWHSSGCRGTRSSRGCSSPRSSASTAPGGSTTSSRCTARGRARRSTASPRWRRWPARRRASGSACSSPASPTGTRRCSRRRWSPSTTRRTGGSSCRSARRGSTRSTPSSASRSRRPGSASTCSRTRSRSARAS